MKVFSLFSGVGGFELGMPKEWKIIGFSEIDKFASQVLKYHYPKVKNYEDCRTIKWQKVPNFDLLTGGSPCQDFSIAGKRRGLAGSKSSLAWEFIRALREKQPKYFIWENVKGVLSSRSGWDFANLLSAFSESGYSLWWQVLNAKDFGVPQNRERVFVCGFREGSPKEIFFESKDSKQIKIVGSTIGDDNTRIGERDSVYGDDGIMGGLKATDYKQPPQIMVKNKGESQHYRLYDEKGISPTLQSQSGMSSQKHPFIVASRGRNPENPKSRKSGLKTEQMLEPNLTGNSNTLTGVEKDNYVVIEKENKYRFCKNDKRKSGIQGKDIFKEDIRTIDIIDNHPKNIIQGSSVRKLMPIECERLMSYFDDWTRWGIDDKGNKVEISDSQRYKMCGNGVVSNIVRKIIEHVIIE